MSNEIDETGPDAWSRIASDPELKRARQKLSMHEFRLIIRHAQAAPKRPGKTVKELEAEFIEVARKAGYAS